MSVLVGKQAPDFDVPAVLGNGEIVDSFKLSEAIKGKYGLVFFYPLDFTLREDRPSYTEKTVRQRASGTWQYPANLL